MNTRILMILSAVWLGATGVVASFLPQEMLAAAGTSAAAIPVLLLQLLGAAYIGFAMLNWMARGVLMGGIYARPLAMGNFLHHAIAGITLIRFSLASSMTATWVAGVLFGGLALAFGRVVFTHPGSPDV